MAATVSAPSLLIFVVYGTGLCLLNLKNSKHAKIISNQSQLIWHGKIIQFETRLVEKYSGRIFSWFLIASYGPILY